MDATFPPGVPWKAKETAGSASPRERAASLKRLYAAANCGLGLKELIANPDRLKARRVMCSTCMSTSSIDSGVLALSCGVSSCCQSAKSDTMRLAPFSLLSCPSLHTHERETRDGQYTHTRGRRRAHRRPLSAPSRPSRSCVRGAPQQLLTRWHPASPGHLPPPPRHHALPLRLPPDCSWPQNFVLFFLVHLIIKHVAQRCDVRRARTTTRTVVLCARYMCPRTVEAPCVRSFAALQCLAPARAAAQRPAGCAPPPRARWRAQRPCSRGVPELHRCRLSRWPAGDRRHGAGAAAQRALPRRRQRARGACCRAFR